MAEPISKPKLHADKFEDLLFRRGRKVRWREAMICSCWNLDSGQPSYNCQACKGVGYVYSDPVEAIAGFTSIAFNKDFNEFAGMFEAGDAIMTVPARVKVMELGRYVMKAVPLFNVGVQDFITLTDDDWKFTEILIKGERIGKRQADTLLNNDVTRLRGLSTSDKVSGVITQYVPGVDFNLVDNTVVWLGSPNQPADGTQYSVTYFYRPTFTVLIQLPKPRHQDNQDLPKHVILRHRPGGFTKDGAWVQA